MEIKNKKGFTLIELLVVVAVIGLLSSVILVSISAARARGRDARRLQDIRQFASALEMFFIDKGSYPTNSTAANSFCKADAANCMIGFSPKYLSKIPVAPVPADVSSTFNCNNTYGAGIGNDYQYAGAASASTINSYTITFCISSKSGILDPGIHTLTNKGVQ